VLIQGKPSETTLDTKVVYLMTIITAFQEWTSVRVHLLLFFTFLDDETFQVYLGGIPVFDCQFKVFMSTFSLPRQF